MSFSLGLVREVAREERLSDELMRKIIGNVKEQSKREIIICWQIPKYIN